MRKLNWPIIVTWTIMLGIGYLTLRAIVFMLKAIL